MSHAANIYRLGIKELWSLARDPIMVALIAYSFTVSIYVAATAIPETLHKAPIAIVDEDAVGGADDSLRCGWASHIVPGCGPRRSMARIPRVGRNWCCAIRLLTKSLSQNYKPDGLTGSKQVQ